MRQRNEHTFGLQISDEAMQLLTDYTWPGNVRELANLIERLVVIRPNGVVGAVDLPWPIVERGHGQSELPEILSATLDSVADETLLSMPAGGVDLKEYLAGIERDMIQNALSEAEGVVQRAAELLGIGRTTLVEKIRRYEINGSNP